METGRPSTPQAGVTRSEVDNLFYRAESRAREDREEILAAIKDLKVSMNGQFRFHGQRIEEHGEAIAVLEDRGSRDNVARWGAIAGGVVAAIAAYLGLK